MREIQGQERKWIERPISAIMEVAGRRIPSPWLAWNFYNFSAGDCRDLQKLLTTAFIQ